MNNVSEWGSFQPSLVFSLVFCFSYALPSCSHTTHYCTQSIYYSCCSHMPTLTLLHCSCICYCDSSAFLHPCHSCFLTALECLCQCLIAIASCLQMRLLISLASLVTNQTSVVVSKSGHQSCSFLSPHLMRLCLPTWGLLFPPYLSLCSKLLIDYLFRALHNVKTSHAPFKNFLFGKSKL